MVRENSAWAGLYALMITVPLYAPDGIDTDVAKVQRDKTVQQYQLRKKEYFNTLDNFRTTRSMKDKQYQVVCKEQALLNEYVMDMTLYAAQLVSMASVLRESRKTPLVDVLARGNDHFTHQMDVAANAIQRMVKEQAVAAEDLSLLAFYKQDITRAALVAAALIEQAQRVERLIALAVRHIEATVDELQEDAGMAEQERSIRMQLLREKQELLSEFNHRINVILYKKPFGVMHFKNECAQLAQELTTLTGSVHAKKVKFDNYNLTEMEAPYTSVFQRVKSYFS